jgi:hypothetical protein
MNPGIICIIIGVISVPIFLVLGIEYSEGFWGIGEGFHGNEYLYGLIGSSLFIIGGLVLNVMHKKTNSTNSGVKKCPFCANDIKTEAVFCQFCGKELPKEQTKLLKKHLGINTIPGEGESEAVSNDTLKEGDILIVKRTISLKDKLGTEGKDIIRLNMNDSVKYIATFKDAGLYPWYLVETENGERGYYVSLDFSKK